MSYKNAVLAARPSQYYPLSGLTGAYDIAGAYIRKNLVSYPSAESGTTAGWSSTDTPTMTFAVSSAQSFSGTKSYLCTSPSSGDMTRYPSPGAEASPVTPGVTYTGSVYVRAVSTAASCYAIIVWWNASNTWITTSYGTPTTDSSTGWTRLVVTATAPAGAVTASVGVGFTATGAGEGHYFDAVMLEESTFVGSYFDGSTNNGWWSGTANASISYCPLSISGYTSKTAPGMVPGYTIAGTSGATGLNSLGIMSSGTTGTFGQTTAKRDAFTLEFWCNPGSGAAYDDGSPLIVPLLTVPGSGSGVYYYKDRFRFWLINGSTQYYSDYFAPESDIRYNVSAVFLGTAFYIVVNGAASEPVLLDSPFTFGYNETYFKIGPANLQHLAIYNEAHSLAQIRARVNAGLFSHNMQEVMVRDKAQVHALDMTDMLLGVNDDLGSQDFAYADTKNISVNASGNFAIPAGASVSSVYPGGATGSVFGSTGYQFVGSTGSGTNNFLYSNDIHKSCSSTSGIIAAQVSSPATAHTIWTIATPSRGKEWVLGVGATGLPQIVENETLADGTLTSTTYKWGSVINSTRLNNVSMVMSPSGVLLHFDTTNANSSIRQYAGTNYVPVNIVIDSTTEFYGGQDTTKTATPPTAIAGLAFYDNIPTDYTTYFDSLATRAPNVIYPLTSDVRATQYGEMTITSNLPYSGVYANSQVEYGIVDGLAEILGTTGLVAYYDARYVNGITGSPPATGAALSQWNDLSGNARHVTGATTFRPSYSPTGSNGLPAVSFVSASSQQLSYTSNNFLPGQTGLTVYSVASPVGVTAAGNGQALGPYLSSTGDARLIISLSTLGTTGRMWLRTNTTAASDLTPRGLVPDGTPSVYSATANYSTKDISMSCNGMRYNAVASWSAGTTDPISNIAVGGTFGRHLNGNICAVAIFIGVHDAETRAAIEGYLSLAWGLPAPKGSGVAMKYNSLFYSPVKKRGRIPNFGPTGTIGIDTAAGPLATKVVMSTKDMSTWTPQFSSINIKIPTSANIDGTNYSDQAQILSYGLSLSDKYREPQAATHLGGAYFQTGGQIRVPADTINSYEMLVVPGTNVGTGEILCINTGTHYALTLTGLVLTSTGFTSVYVNGVLLSGSATLVPNVANHIVAITTTQLASPAYLNGHSDGTLKNSKYSTQLYAQYNYQLSATQIADHYNAADGLMEGAVVDTDTYSTVENIAPNTYSYTWDASNVSQV